MKEDLNYWKENAEEDYKLVPISVLKYIRELEKEFINKIDMKVKAKFKFKVHKDSKSNLTWGEAKIYCKSLGEGWRMPNRVELLLMYENKEGFDDNYYWSSTEIDNRSAWVQTFGFGNQFDHYKDGTYCVRAIKDIN